MNFLKDASVVDGGPVVVPVGKGSKVTKSALEGGMSHSCKAMLKLGGLEQGFLKAIVLFFCDSAPKLVILRCIFSGIRV